MHLVLVSGLRCDRVRISEVAHETVDPNTRIALVVWSTSSAQGQTPAGTTGSRPAATASANLVDAQGRSVGQALLQQTPHGVLLKLELKNATPGIHGLHIHDVGRCDRPAFE
jgi:Cu-Zn family superoxide dismutase